MDERGRHIGRQDRVMEDRVIPEKLFYLQGIGADYQDSQGQCVAIDPEVRRRLLFAMTGPPAIGTDPWQQRIDALDAHPWLQLAPAFQITDIDTPTLEVYQPQELTAHFSLSHPQATPLQIEARPHWQHGEYWYQQRRFVRYHLPLPPDWLSTDATDTELTVYQQGRQQRVTLCRTPARCYQAPARPERSWGLNLQLYRLRTSRQWGIGDFADLHRLIDWLGPLGADFIQLNPLHTPDPHLKGNVSPYAAADRHCLSPLYLAPEWIEEYSSLAAEFQRPQWLGPRQRLAEADWLDYDAIARLKFALFDRLHQQFLQTVCNSGAERDQAYQRFVRQHGERLQQYRSQEHQWLWQQLQLETHPDLPLFLQFEARRQQARCQARCQALGMVTGLIADLPVGVPPTSCEVAADPQHFCRHASIGAPPDPFAAQGQDWGLAPADPVIMKQQHFRHWRSLLDANMNHCGALRIDHIMGLRRQWWCLPGEAPGIGGYVYYPHEQLFDLLALHSHNHGCEVIGENLGIVPPEIDQQMQHKGIAGTQLLHFCLDSQGRYLAPDTLGNNLMLMTSNHDVPPLAQWWQGGDLHLLQQLQLLSAEQLPQRLQQRRRQKQALLEWLTRFGDSPATDAEQDWNFELMAASLLTLAKSRANRFALQLDDLLLSSQPVNIPGTWKQYRNWQLRLSQPLACLEQDPQIHALLQQIDQLRRQPRPTP
ncbi:4-alpha-glucanotransferase [Ferrimonas sp. SCSIO 43195]|uniref:4-alpha-glucanotransferase n=1 Tax=Ferrimonas sp. SCSIO 43195 TaxID=2822844 RepID=UPI00207564F6|nr:4-alpha-glucanotransferase [Ferrimonas sp. SCSIO 43195]USD36443.1 4-alpha-glucanotransferase [Ferrimonas sp. SCSIO 43195]